MNNINNNFKPGDYVVNFDYFAIVLDVDDLRGLLLENPRIGNGMPNHPFVPRTFLRLRGSDHELQNRIRIVAGVGDSSSRKIFTRCRQDCRPTFVVGFYWPLFRKTSEHNRKPEQKADNHCSQAADQL